MKALNFFVKRDACGGCRLCEVACSFYKTGKCQPSASAIKVLDNPVRGVPTPAFTPDCDCKDGEEECIKFCPSKIIQWVHNDKIAEYMRSPDWTSCVVLPSQKQL
jgi:Fe-S-cluster-containing hydrogenase component 2